MTPSTPSSRLRTKMELAHPVLRLHAEALWGSDRVVALYPAYLQTMHTVVRSAVPLMEAARRRAEELAETDEVAAGLADYLRHHVDEERGHDEWLLEDLSVTGGDPTAARRRIPTATVAGLVGAQYYWIHHYHPVALLGHVAAIEGYPPPLGFAKRLQRLTGYPREAFRAISIHERLDIKHGADLWAAIDRLPLTSIHETLIGLSALHTINLSIDVFDELLASGVGLSESADPPTRQAVAALS